MSADYPLWEDRLAACACGEGPALPAAALAQAARHCADLIAVTLAAAAEPSLKALAHLFPTADAHSASASLWGTDRRFALQDAGTLNAYAGHWHDFDDDETELAMAHVTVSALTAAAVAGDRQPGVSVKEVLTAYITGTEVAFRLGRLINPRHYRAGWHATATLGTFAACAAAGRLLALTPAEMRHALGIAASRAAGLRSNFGSDSKPLQVGLATGAGIFAAQAAKAGLQSAVGSLLGPSGYIALHGGDIANVAEVLRDFGAPYGFIGDSMTLKAFPCCTASHTSLAALLHLRETMQIEADQIDRILCHIDPAVPGILIYDHPRTATEAKFSLPFALAVAAVYGRAGITEFTDQTVAEPAVQAMMARVERRLDPELPKGPSGISTAGRIEIFLKDGQHLTEAVASVPGSAGNPMSDAALKQKFIACAADYLGHGPAADMFDQLIGSLDMPCFATLLGSLRPPVGQLQTIPTDQGTSL